MHGKAKEQAEIDGEKEIVETSTIQVMGKNKYGNVTKFELEEKLNSNAGDGKTEVIDDGENFVVKFIESNRYYKVDNDGNVEYFEVIVDEHPGNIKVGIKGEELTGTEERPFEIWCIEDLAEWSQNYTEYINSYIKLGRTLNFNSNLSYTDGKVLNCSSVDELKELLTNTSGSGFTPISTFNGDFDGQGYEIQNIYINSQLSNVALIGSTSTPDTCIKNLGITGSITGVMNVGGILGYAKNSENLKISNCYNKANIYNYSTYTGVTLNGVGGILGYSQVSVVIERCYNVGNIYSASELNTYGYSGVGGILGKEHFEKAVINNCYNTGKIEGKGCRAGGISGSGASIYNCYNSGEIIKGAGINGYGGEVVNCFNTGIAVNGIYGSNYATTISIKNVYTTAKISEYPIVNWSNSACTYDILNAFYSENCIQNDNRGTKISEVLMKSNGSKDTDDEKALLTLLNNFVDEYNNSENEIELNHWKIDSENGYPMFE